MIGVLVADAHGNCSASKHPAAWHACHYRAESAVTFSHQCQDSTMMIRARHVFAMLLLALPLGTLPAYAQQANGLQQRMTPEQFKAAGLYKQSPAELAYLEHWLATQDKPATKMVDASGEPVFYASKAKRERIDTNIVGAFTGWEKNREFTMANTQVWRVIDPNSHRCKSATDPAVQIKPSLLGTWLMYVPSCYENVHVKRVR
jgi:hypothetical protein